MEKVRDRFIKNLRYLCLIGVIALGLMTILGSSGGGGSPVEAAPAAVEAPKTEASAVKVEAPVETGPEITGGAVKDVEKSWFKEVLEITYLKVKLVFRRVWNFFRNFPGVFSLTGSV